MLSFLFCMVLYFFLSKANLIYKTLVFFFIGFSIILIFQSIDYDKLSPILGRLTYESLSEGAGRVDLWKSAIILLKEEPVHGIGIGQFVHHSREYTAQVFGLKNSVVQEWDLSLHNTYLQVLVEFGWFGFILFIGMNYYLFVETYSTYLKSKKTGLSIFFLVTLTITLVQGMFHSSFILPSYFFFISLIICHNNYYQKS